MTHIDSRNRRFVGSASAMPAKAISVDASRSIHARQDGSPLYPYREMLAGIEGFPIGTTQAEFQTPNLVKVAAGTYDEALRIDIRRNITILSDYAWDLGEFNASGGSQSGVRRNITLTGDASFINGVPPQFRIINGTSPDRASNAAVNNISGQILNEMVVRGGSVILDGVRIWGSNSGNTGTCIDMTGGEPSNFIMANVVLNGGFDLDGGAAWLGDCSLRGDTCSLGAVVLADCTEFDCADFNVTAAFDASAFSNPSGFLNCAFDRAMNYTWGAGALTPFVVDAYTNDRSKDFGVTLGGGATKVIVGDLTA